MPRPNADARSPQSLPPEPDDESLLEMTHSCVLKRLNNTGDEATLRHEDEMELGEITTHPLPTCAERRPQLKVLRFSSTRGLIEHLTNELLPRETCRPKRSRRPLTFSTSNGNTAA